MIKVQDIINILEKHAPLPLQETWDNCGLHVGDAQMEISGVLCTLDVTLEVLHEALEKNCNMIVAHHPLIFSGLKSLTGRNDAERCVIEAVKRNLAIYSAHTNMDNVAQGVSGKIAEKLGLKQCRIMAPQPDNLLKIIVFVPKKHSTAVRNAMFEAGAGHIGNYDACSFATQGQGSFRALEGAHPYLGKPGVLHHEEEVRLELVLPHFKQGAVLAAMKTAHPYEEVAYDLLSLKNTWETVGLGIIGVLGTPFEETAFLKKLKEIFTVPVVRHSPLRGKKVKKVAVMGGSGASYLKSAMAAKVDFFVTSDVKYHDFFLPEGRLVLADVGHYESEQYTKELFKEIITKKITTFVPQISETDTNYVKYH